jgi:hypothetical protein
MAGLPAPGVAAGDGTVDATGPGAGVVDGAGVGATADGAGV